MKIEAIEENSIKIEPNKNNDPSDPLINLNEDLSTNEDVKKEKEPADDFQHYSESGRICKLCNITISSKHCFIRHYKRFHQDTTDKRPHECDICHKTFLTAGNLYRHKKVVHEKKQQFECNLCGKSFTELRSLRCHKQSKHGDKSDSRQCKVCNKTFNAKTYRRHMNEVHEKKKTKKCNLCTKTFSRPKHLEDHISLVHDEIGSTKPNKQLKCDICEVTFTQSGSLNIHIRTRHENKGSECDLCKRVLHNKHFLEYHIRAIHQNKKNYQCCICQKSFNMQSQMTNHMKKIHEEKKKKCFICNLQFKECSSLKYHFIKVHGNQ